MRAACLTQNSENWCLILGFSTELSVQVSLKGLVNAEIYYSILMQFTSLLHIDETDSRFIKRGPPATPCEKTWLSCENFSEIG
jgi:hypothetical protein